MADRFLWKYYDKSQYGPTVRSPNSNVTSGGNTYRRFPPFTPRAYKDSPAGEWYPLYAPRDATDTVQGVTWLTDTYSATLKAANGMTAMTPFGVGDYVTKNALVKSTSSSQTVSGPVDFTGNVTFGGDSSAPSAKKLKTARNFQFKIGSNASNVVAFNGEQDVTLTIDSINAGSISGGTLPLSVIPQGALERLVRVPTLNDMYKLTKDQVQAGDTVKVGTGSSSSLYIVVDDTKLSSASGYEQFAAGTSTLALQADEFSSARKIELTGDVTGSATSTGKNGWSIATTYAGILPVGKGGTGVTTYNDLRNKLGLGSDSSKPLPIANGGTGATTAAGVLTNLGITATATELNYCDGVTSSIQTQLNGKASTNHDHYYAASAEKGGPASLVAGIQATANANRHVWFSDMSEEKKRCYNDSFMYNPSGNTLSCNISGKAATAGTAETSNKVANGGTVGSSSKPVYINAGVVTECSYSISAITDAQINSLF